MEQWNPGLYASSHSFVWEFGRDLLTLLAPAAGERVLDLGCGTGQLTAEIAKSGAVVVGVDRSAGMITEACTGFPGLRLAVCDATCLPFREAFDAVFSNAVLHWVMDAEGAARSISRALRRGGRFVAELGGHGNIARLLRAVYRALEATGVPNPGELNPWYYPTIAEYASVLESNGLLVTSAALFDRPTRLAPGRESLANWLAMFGACFTNAVPPPRRTEFIRLVESEAAPDLLESDVWTVDYRRLRIVAVRH